MQTSILMYDIHGKKFPNPTDRLRPRALRINESVWVIDDARAPWEMLNQMTEAGVTWHKIGPFSASANEGVLAVALTEMRKQLDEKRTNEATSLSKQDATLDAVLNNPESTERQRYDARKKHASDRAATLKNSEKLVRDLETAAAAFGMTTETLNFSDAYTRINGLRNLNGARAALFTEAKQTMQQIEPTLANAMDDGSVPVGIVADRLMDAGEDTDALRAAFDDRHDTDETPVTVQTSGSGSPVAPVATREPGEDDDSDDDDDDNGDQPDMGEPVARIFTADNRTVRSTFTDREAAEILRDAPTSFGRSLAVQFFRSLQSRTNRPLSFRQLAFLHILAVEHAPELV